MRRRFIQAAVPLLVGLLASRGSAQRGLTIHVRVIDTAGVPLQGAEVSVSHDLTRVLAVGLTDARGMRTLTFARDANDYDVTARRIGYVRADRYFAAPKGDTASFDLVLVPAPQTLAPVTITAEQDLKRKSYHVDADEIANSTRLIMTGMDVLTKMKPDILEGRAPGCGVREIWINGRRIVNPPVNDVAAAHIPKFEQPPTPPPPGAPKLGVNGRSGALPPGLELHSPLAGVPRSVWSIMWTIKPEHIQEMEYKDCMDTSMPGLHASSALFIVLKPGVAYEAGRGTYVVGTPKPKKPATIASGPLYRYRVLGVFDDAGGAPIPGVQVVDDASGTMALTTATGTVTLAFLPEGESSITIRKAGFATQKLDVTISPADTTPITLVLPKSPPPPP